MLKSTDPQITQPGCKLRDCYLELCDFEENALATLGITSASRGCGETGVCQYLCALCTIPGTQEVCCCWLPQPLPPLPSSHHHHHPCVLVFPSSLLTGFSLLVHLSVSMNIISPRFISNQVTFRNLPVSSPSPHYPENKSEIFGLSIP